MAYLLNGRFNNLVYGSYAPGAADVFLNDAEFAERWRTVQRYYFVVDEKGLERIQPTVPDIRTNVVAISGGKFLLTNHPI
jgi:hypothetical protein